MTRQSRMGVFTLCLFLCLLSAPTAHLSADNPIIVKVGIYENPPKISTDDQGRAQGFWVDIISHIALQEDWQVTYVHGSWSECLDRLAKNEIDIMPDVAYTEERSERYDFSSEVVYTSWGVVYARDGSSIQSVLDLESKTVAVMKGSVNYEGTNGIRELATTFDVTCTFLEKDSYGAVFEAVRRGEAEAGVTSKDHGYQHGADFGLVETPIVFQPSLLYFAFAKSGEQTPHLIERTDARVRELKADSDSVYYQSLRRWFSQTTPGEPIVPTWLLTALGIAAGLALLFAAGASVLRKQVAARTKELTEEMARRKEAESELARSHEHLEELVRQRTKELEEANLHKSQFLANMSHELRTPLNSIIGYTKLMLDGLEGPTTSDQKDDLQTVYNNSKHLLSLINDLLDLSKIEAGKFEIVKEEYDVDELVSQIVPSMQKLAADKGLKLSCNVASGVRRVYSDKNKTKQVLFNLLGNAVKFTQKGSVELSIDANDSEYVFSVSDTGVGMTKSDVDSLFQSYKQVGPARLDGSEGTGLGLVISKQFVEMQGGRIWVESTPDEGSTFTFTLPINQVNPQVQHSGKENPRGSTHG